MAGSPHWLLLLLLRLLLLYCSVLTCCEAFITMLRTDPNTPAFFRYVDCPQYRIGQLYMISKHSHEQSERGEGVEVVQNEPYDDPEHGSGQFTEKRIYLNNKLPSWARAVVPKIFYVTEKAWNYYPYTITVLYKRGSAHLIAANIWGP
ncbi:hypothetical protein JOQ06_011153 [Pogonophryne albipinna]|uniref:Phosphatidylinositol transfer protein N-terminal domain-containing protein n=1 Tax=Pogonophryne albipinna TaxID=1090488 RepID=A0AAD6FFC6_9TELE|nr:hypothetical protein JOQ06_011153 [Pogonophryne albipinna]